ncbi:hypothetical protein SDC9_114578 [bioreactor metagenome]|uniref:BD-FAE-like domain-containing protein n=1 Tax=bioreactor metagenome TaxID=1076179 RepID=A0A645C113_9ZZZZ
MPVPADWLQWPQHLRDAAYDNTAAVADSAAQLADFESRSAVLAARAVGDLDVRYGAAPRQCFDYFSGQPGAPTLLFIHGGYWQMRHKNTFRFVAQGALAHGLNAALIGYTLAPDATLGGIVQEVHEGIAAVRAHGLARGASDQLLLCGWSAGGHLAAMGLACEGVVAGLGMSGIYDLEPLRTTYLNRALQLSDADVQCLSPQRLDVLDKPFVTAYGTAELPQLQMQSLDFFKHRGSAQGTLVAVAGTNHFNILNALSAPDGELLAKLMASARLTHSS